jgi:putative resolvase
MRFVQGEGPFPGGANGQVSHLIIAHKDRLVRFGFPWFERFCAEHGTELMVLNDEQL